MAKMAPSALSAISTIKEQIPVLEDEVVVEVRGQPGATKKQLYYLALSAAFGLIRRFDLGVNGVYVAVPPGVLMVEYDAADNWVRATVRFRTSLITTSVTIALPMLNPLPIPLFGTLFADSVNDYLKEKAGLDFYGEAVVFSGPKEEVVGGKFNFAGVLTPAVPTTARSRGAPKLPFEGRVILTTAPSVKEPIPAPGTIGGEILCPNPKPPGDNRSRGTITEGKNPLNPSDGLRFDNNEDIIRRLIPLVYASLTEDGNEQRFVDPKDGPRGS